MSQIDFFTNSTRRLQMTDSIELTIQSLQAYGAEHQKFKLIEWSDELRAVMREALSLQRTTSMYIFGSSEGSPTRPATGT